MLVISVKEGEQIDRALKRLKRKFLQTGTLKRLRAKKQYLKPTGYIFWINNSWFSKNNIVNI